MSDARSIRRAGFTLLEMTVSIVVITIIMSAVASAMLLARRALGVAVADLETDPLAESLDEMATDLALAQSFTFRTERGVGVWVADRDGDGVREHIAYGWNGEPGSALRRQVNFGRIVSIAEGVQSLDLDWVERPVSATRIDMVESGPTLLHGHASTGAMVINGVVDAERQWGAWFVPTLPDDAVHWSLTRVIFRARQVGLADGTLVVEIRTATGNAPTDVVLAAVAVPEWTLGAAHQWVEVEFPALTHLDPTQPLCLVIASGDGVMAGEVEYENQPLPNSPDAMLIRSPDGGLTWSSFTNRDLLLHVYGTFTTAEPAS